MTKTTHPTHQFQLTKVSKGRSLQNKEEIETLVMFLGVNDQFQLIQEPGGIRSYKIKITAVNHQ